MTSYKTEREIRKIPLFDGKRNSNVCSICGRKGGSSIGNSTYSQDFWFHWWHCAGCKHDYDLVVTPHKLPPGMKSPFDKAPKAPKAKAPKRLKGF